MQLLAPRIFLAAAAVAVAATGVGAVVWWAGRPDPDREAGLRLARVGEFAAAEPLLATAATRDPWDQEVAGELARCYLATADARAEDVLTRWVKAHPENPEPVRLRMEYYWKAHDPRAVEDAKLLVKMECRDPDIRYKVLEYAFEFGMYDEAENRCQTILRRQPGDVDMRVKLAKIQKARGDLPAAAATLDAVLKEHPAHPGALVARAALHQAGGRYDEAVPLLRRAVDADPARRRELADQLATALEQAGRPDDAARTRAAAGPPPDARP